MKGLELEPGPGVNQLSPGFSDHHRSIRGRAKKRSAQCTYLPGVRPQGQGVHYEANLYFREKTSEFVISLLFCESLYWGCRSCLDYFSAPAIHFNMVLKTYSIVEWLFCQSRSFLERVVLYVVVVLMFPWEEMGSGSFYSTILILWGHPAFLNGLQLQPLVGKKQLNLFFLVSSMCQASCPI